MKDDDFSIDLHKLTPYYDEYTYKITMSFPRFMRTPRYGSTGRLILWQDEEFYSKAEIADIQRNENDYKNFKYLLKSSNLVYKLVQHYSYVNIYFNDLHVAELAKQRLPDFFEKGQKTKIEKSSLYEKGVIYLKNPGHKFRVFLREQRYSTEDRRSLRHFIEHKVEIYPSRSLWAWLTTKDSKITWCWGHYSFDLDDEAIITLITLKFPKLIKKISRIEIR